MGFILKFLDENSQLFLFEICLVTLYAARIMQRAGNWAFICCINRSKKLSFLAC
jgi:hypothetical protein